MGGAWQERDLGGGGLQSANPRLAALLKKRRTAWLLLCTFPLGLHRDYRADFERRLRGPSPGKPDLPQ